MTMRSIKINSSNWRSQHATMKAECKSSHSALMKRLCATFRNGCLILTCNNHFLFCYKLNLLLIIYILAKVLKYISFLSMHVKMVNIYIYLHSFQRKEKKDIFIYFLKQRILEK